ncbi:PD40 domain-containing protein [Bacillus sp. ISL-55]|uniref:TolB family protein n=1 Tax=Bacillus sp. ISL-55 TaxID=2819134 RepID=UPI001BED0D49|nr:PD40 domain-containing protein [Bacillus sp. ISL-55]MBT2695729.1 PD40 domain-containing protein [Bacillus sp. ISL-55]
MSRNKTLLGAIAFVALLLISSISYMLLADRDAYSYYTGLGSGLAISNDDQLIAFSYFNNGKSAIYTAGQDGTNVKRVSNPHEVYHSDPKFSPDGSKILYLSQDRNHIQSLYIANVDGTNPKQLSESSQHISGAVFSDDNETIFFASMPAEEFKKTEGETQEGYDLFSVKIDGSQMEQLSDRDFYTMDSLAFSAEKKEILFKDFDDINAFDLKDQRVYTADLSGKIPTDFFHLTLSPKLNALAYTTITDESKDTSLFEYDLFLIDLQDGDTKRLTDLNSSVVSPVFFNEKNEVLFLEYFNWPQEPEEYKLRTVDIETKKLKELTLEMPDLESSNFVMKAIDYSVNSWTVGLIYTVLFMLITVYVKHEKVFLPSLISLAIGLLTLAASFVVAATVDPWAGIGVGMLAAGLLVCTIVLFLFALVIKILRKGAK